MTRAKHFILYLMAVMLAVGIGGCKKESEELKEPTPQDKPVPDPNKPDPQKPDLYQEAFESMKQTHDYNKLVEDLVEAAKANVDSANLSLAYMYEYGVGVEQDIAKAKSYYAREAALNSNEFALEKSKMLGSDDFNYELSLPEGCSLKMNDVVVVYGDSLTLANGNGSFNASSDVVVVKNLQNEYVGFCYRHPSNPKKIEINSTETAISLLLCAVPYGLSLSEEAYAEARMLFLDMEETRLIIEELDKQIETNGSFDVETLEPLLTQAYDHLYTKFGVNGNSISKKTCSLSKMGSGGDDTHSIVFEDNYGHRVGIVNGAEQNEVSTFIKKGYYNDVTNAWELSLHIENLSQSCFMAVSGSIDPKTGEFVPMYNNDDYYLKSTFIDASKFLDLGGGSLTGLVESLRNYMAVAWENACTGDYTSADRIDLVGDFEGFYTMWADTHYDYRKKYLAVKEDVDVEVSDAFFAIKYVYPNDDLMVGAYYTLYYLAVPIVESFLASKGIKWPDDNLGLILMKEFVLDKDWMDSFRQCVASGVWNFTDKKAGDFWFKTFCKIFDIIVDVTKSITGMTIANKNDVNFVKSAVKIYDKFSVEDVEHVEKSVITIAKEVEKKLTADNKELKSFLKILSSAESLVSYFSGLGSMLFKKDYGSFLVKVAASSEQFELSYVPAESVWSVFPYDFVVKSSKYGDIFLYANDKLIASEKDAVQLKYDLSTLETGIYEIKIVCNANDGISKKESSFRCVVNDDPVSILASINSLSCEKDESLVLSAELSRLCDIEVFVDDESFYRGDNIDQFYITLPSSVAGTHNGRIVAKIKGVNVAEKPFSYNVYAPLSITHLTLTANSVEQDEALVLSGKVSETCDIAVYVENVLLSTIKNNNEFYVTMPTDKVGKFTGKIKASTRFDENEQSFSYSVTKKPDPSISAQGGFGEGLKDYGTAGTEVSGNKVSTSNANNKFGDKLQEDDYIETLIEKDTHSSSNADNKFGDKLQEDGYIFTY